MKTEIECRLLNVDAKKFIYTLKQKGASYVGDWLQCRYCYDFNPVRPNSWIRLRTNGVETTLTIKEIGTDKIDGTKECEIVVSDFDTTNEILNRLGYTARSIQENRRIRFSLDGVEIDIDFWPQIPPYVEFEADSPEQIKSVCNKLGIDFNNLTTIDVQSVYTHYGIDLQAQPIVTLEEDKKTLEFEL